MIQILMMIQNLVVIIVLEGKTLKVVTLKVVVLVQFQNKLKDHRESDKNQEGLQILTCCRIMKLT